MEHTHYREPTIVFRIVSIIDISPLIRDIINKTMMMMILMVIKTLFLVFVLLLFIYLDINHFIIRY